MVKEERNLKVYEASGYQYSTTSTIILKGKWLQELGFEVGANINVSCEEGRIVITKK
ncbi:MAG: SymE family type I addiction module toxin [Anaerovoracaceae bacterium]